VLALKENQSKLFAAAARRYARSGARSVAERREPVTHDRCEWRRATVLRDATFAAVQKFPGVVALARITSRRRVLGACAEPPQVRYFLLSKYIPAKQLLRIVRSHWGIENQLHWVLDVVFNEDRNRTRKDNAPENLAILRSLPSIWCAATPQPPENQTSGMGRRLPLGHARSYAIALPLVGEGRLGREPSCKATERVARAVSTSTG
jgi:hypothetical protein